MDKRKNMNYKLTIDLDEHVLLSYKWKRFSFIKVLISGLSMFDIGIKKDKFIDMLKITDCENKKITRDVRSVIEFARNAYENSSYQSGMIVSRFEEIKEELFDECL
jgi:hypothetical protein